MTSLSNISTFSDTPGSYGVLESIAEMEGAGPGGTDILVTSVRYASSFISEKLYAYPLAGSNIIYSRFMDESAMQGYSQGRKVFDILSQADTADNGMSYIYNYFSGTDDVQYKYVYNDQLWADLSRVFEYDLAGNKINEYTGPSFDKSPVDNGWQAAEGEWSEKSALQAKLQGPGYRKTQNGGGYVLSSTMAGETQGVNPFNGQAL